MDEHYVVDTFNNKLTMNPSKFEGFFSNIKSMVQKQKIEFRYDHFDKKDKILNQLFIVIMYLNE